MNKKIVMTGGGSAGHVSPNMALIPYLYDEGFEIHYFGTNGIEHQLITDNFDFVQYHTIKSGKLRRYFSLKNLTDPFRVIAGIASARKEIKAIKPDVVFSKGGYVSVPVVMAAHKIAPIIAHESDFSPGIATKISARYATKVCTSFEQTAKAFGKKGLYTGSPIRSELFSGNAENGRSFLKFENDLPILLVIGGSLGALAINENIRACLPALLNEFNVAHICGKGKIDAKFDVLEGYNQYEYLSKPLADVFAAADVIVSRAGANAIFEFIALKKPALLIPLPSKSSRGDQLQNAMYYTKKGYFETLEQEQVTKITLYNAIISLYQNKEKYVNSMKKDIVAANGTQNVLNIIYKTAGHKN
ncbi:MAG: undecaprenyldiphospho-muramoylpentapeptide beta-N-acetylglucosaminyltransferase [Clostridiales bacterium]|nr:undecaprenyldiphospho-muramoylpentapeptide beta-N-acetylglucosaminyltransferase [Clostridiales bacterium]